MRFAPGAPAANDHFETKSQFIDSHLLIICKWEGIFTGLMASDRKIKVSREGSE